MSVSHKTEIGVKMIELILREEKRLDPKPSFRGSRGRVDKCIIPHCFCIGQGFEPRTLILADLF